MKDPSDWPLYRLQNIAKAIIKDIRDECMLIDLDCKVFADKASSQDINRYIRLSDDLQVFKNIHFDTYLYLQIKNWVLAWLMFYSIGVFFCFALQFSYPIYSPYLTDFIFNSHKYEFTFITYKEFSLTNERQALEQLFRENYAITIINFSASLVLLLYLMITCLEYFRNRGRFYRYSNWQAILEEMRVRSLWIIVIAVKLCIDFLDGNNETSEIVKYLSTLNSLFFILWYLLSFLLLYALPIYVTFVKLPKIKRRLNRIRTSIPSVSI